MDTRCSVKHCASMCVIAQDRSGSLGPVGTIWGQWETMGDHGEPRGTAGDRGDHGGPPRGQPRTTLSCAPAGGRKCSGARCTKRMLVEAVMRCVEERVGKEAWEAMSTEERNRRYMVRQAPMRNRPRLYLPPPVARLPRMSNLPRLDMGSHVCPSACPCVPRTHYWVCKERSQRRHLVRERRLHCSCATDPVCHAPTVPVHWVSKPRVSA